MAKAHLSRSTVPQILHDHQVSLTRHGRGRRHTVMIPCVSLMRSSITTIGRLYIIHHTPTTFFFFSFLFSISKTPMPWAAELSQTSLMEADNANTSGRQGQQLIYLKCKKLLPFWRFRPRPA